VCRIEKISLIAIGTPSKELRASQFPSLESLSFAAASADSSSVEMNAFDDEFRT
jgi:hypothetical protein